MSEQNTKRREISLKKRMEKEEKISLAKESQETVLAETRRRFAERETISHNRRLEFEASRKKSFDMAKLRARAKSIAMKKAFDDAKQMEAQRRDDMLEVMRKTEIRQSLLKQEEERRIKEKRRQAVQRQAYQRQIAEAQRKLEADKVERMRNARDQKERTLYETMQRREFDQMLRREAELLKREERLENVARIAKANEYAAVKVKQKIEYDMRKAETIAAGKAEMLATRFQVRRQADEQKRETLKKVEALKKKGKIGWGDLAALGLGGDDENPTSQADGVVSQDANIQNQTM